MTHEARKHHDKIMVLAERCKALKSESRTTTKLLEEIADSLESVACDHLLYLIFGDIMRKLLDQLKGAVATIELREGELAESAKDIDSLKAGLDTANLALQKASDQATTDANTIKDLQDQLAKLGTPPNPDDTVPETDPTRIKIDTILDDEPATDPPVIETPAEPTPITTVS